MTTIAPSNEVSPKPPPDVVLPPSNVRSNIETTARYIARNGDAFQERMRKMVAAGNTKLSFVNEDDPYHAFYIWRVSEIRAGRGAAEGTVEGATAPIPEAPKGPAAPPDLAFSARMPNISAKDLDVVRLTALFAAKNGRSFMTTLSQKEAGNFQFDFLRPQHSLYQFFSRLVDQYSELLGMNGTDTMRAEKARIVELGKITSSRLYMLNRAKQRAEFVKFQEQQKVKKEERDEKDALEYAQIDWHDFVIVETVVFTEADEEVDLPPPTSLNDLQSASLEQKGAMSLQPHNMRIEEAIPFDDVSFNISPLPNEQYSTPTSSIQLPSRVPQVATIPTQETLYSNAASSATRASSTTGPMKIRNDYVPRAQQRRTNTNLVICPHCKLPVPSEELNEHIRIELLDPKWQSQRAKAESRSATTNLNTADVQNNLKRLASQRMDVFDNATGQPLTPEESDRRKKIATGFAQLPPQQSITGQQGRSIEEQLAHIANKARNQ